MAVKKNSETVHEWKPTTRDTARLAEGMNGFEVKEINGRKWYPFEQFALAKRVISAGERGQLQVVYPKGWKQMMDTYALYKWQQEKDLEKFFISFPKERENYEDKLETIKNEIRALFD